MHFEPTPRQAAVRSAARDLAERMLVPQAADWEKAERLPAEVLREAAAAGLSALQVPEAEGGAGAGPVAFALAIEELARGCASTAVTVSVTNMVAETIARFGTPEQRERHLPAIARGAHLAGSFALSEPEAGSDPGAMRTSARLDGDAWVIDGHKQWITSGALANVILVWARTGPREAGTRTISCFVVEGGTPGVRAGRREDKMGLRASGTVPLELERCRVPASALLGELYGGFRVAMMALDGGRVGIGAQAIGIARAAFEAALAFVRDRSVAQRSGGPGQGAAFALADMHAQIEAARLLVWRAARKKERGEPFTREAALAKLFASETAVRVTGDAVGLCADDRDAEARRAVERHFRDARVTTIYEGTSEVQRAVIARSVLRD
jgi:alkylation response protein AidB-like acyl-CoA dehydrogenase